MLGFGGRPNPLVYARVASFAMRTGQALFHEEGNGARCRGQLYVDDPALVFTGSPAEITTAVDVWLT